MGFLVEIFEIVSSPISLRLGANKNFSTLIIDSSQGSIFIFMASAAYEKNQENFLSLVWENDPINTVTEFLGKNIGQVVSEKVRGEKKLKTLTLRQFVSWQLAPNNSSQTTGPLDDSSLGSLTDLT